jgi:hypothetical protein
VLKPKRRESEGADQSIRGFDPQLFLWIVGSKPKFARFNWYVQANIWPEKTMVRNKLDRELSWIETYMIC